MKKPTYMLRHNWLVDLCDEMWSTFNMVPSPFTTYDNLWTEIHNDRLFWFISTNGGTISGFWLCILSFKWDILLWWRSTEWRVVTINHSMWRIFVIDISLIFLKLFPDEIISLFYNVHVSWGTGIDWVIHSWIHSFIYSSFKFHSFIPFTRSSTLHS